MRIVTWNLWWRFGPWENRQPLIVSELQKLDPDIVCLQEVWADDGVDQAVQLADALEFDLVRTTTAGGDPQSFGNAILSRFPLERAGQQALPAVGGGPGHRSVVAARAQVGERSQLVVNTHLEWRYTESALRQRQLSVIVEFIKSLRAAAGDPVSGAGSADSRSEPDPDAVILAGDFNAVPESQEIRRLTGLEPPYSSDLIFTDAWAAVSDDAGYTWTRDNPNSANALWPRRRLDYVFVSWPRSKPWANPLSARLAGTEYDGVLAPSDHYAVVVELDNRQTLGHG